MAQLISAKRLPLLATYRDPFSLVNRLFVRWVCRDRFGVLNKYSPYDLYNEMGESEKAALAYKDADPVDFKEALDKRAQQIIEAHNRVTVSWSGGVDSTAVVTSLLKNGIDPKNLAILASSSSEEEYPFFYKYLHEIGVNYIESETVCTNFDKVDDGALVTGWCADQLFGSNIHLRNLNWYHMPWMEGVALAFKERGIDVEKNELEQVKEAFWEYSQKLGLPLEQFCEFAFLFNFGVKWSYVSQEPQLTVTKQSIRNRIYNFFDTVEFQHFALQNFSNIREHNANRYLVYYKRPLKEYIYSFTNDDYYFGWKGKQNSWALTAGKFTTVGVWDTDGYHSFEMKGQPKKQDYKRLMAAVSNRYLRSDYI